MKNEFRSERDVRFWIAIAVLLAATALFGVIAEDVATKDPIVQLDLQVAVWLHTHGSPALTAFLLAITYLHSTLGIALLALILAAYLWHRDERYWVLSLALTVSGGLLLNDVLKELFKRSRPVWEDPLLTLASHSFPSGHAAGATLFYGFIAAYVVWRVKSNAVRLMSIAGCTLMVALAGFSRMYLGVHYLSDVLAAIAAGTAWLALCLIGVRALAKRRSAAAATSSPA